ncbi:hypothetical protein [Rhizobium tropici]|uniref:hypothetical protein n=1 Tax=Rhizobium tropici TaxID=398 RepID=UPI00165EF95D|nr:hypothetical protein [Rhizobium tropici]
MDDVLPQIVIFPLEKVMRAECSSCVGMNHFRAVSQAFKTLALNCLSLGGDLRMR